MSDVKEDIRKIFESCDCGESPLPEEAESNLVEAGPAREDDVRIETKITILAGLKESSFKDRATGEPTEAKLIGLTIDLESLKDQIDAALLEAVNSASSNTFNPVNGTWLYISNQFVNEEYQRRR